MSKQKGSEIMQDKLQEVYDKEKKEEVEVAKYYVDLEYLVLEFVDKFLRLEVEFKKRRLK